MPFTGNVANVILPSPKDLPTIGGLYWGPLTGVTIPGATMLVDADMDLLGFIAEDGIDSNRDSPTTSIFAWGGDLVAKPQDSFDATETFTLYEFLNPEVAKAAYNNEVTVTAATVSTGTRLSILETSDAHEMHTWLIDTYGVGGKRVQKFVPIGQVTNKDSQTWNHKTILSHRLTVTLYPDTSGNYAYIRTDDGVFSV